MDLSHLNPSQRTAVECIDGPLDSYCKVRPNRPTTIDVGHGGGEGLRASKGKSNLNLPNIAQNTTIQHEWGDSFGKTRLI